MRDFQQISSYLTEQSPSGGYRVSDHILSAAESLAVLPARGRRGLKEGTRELLVGNWPYVIVYRLEAAETVAVIVRVRHTSMRWP